MTMLDRELFCMDQLMIRTTSPIKQGDIATLSGTITNVLLSRLGLRLYRKENRDILSDKIVEKKTCFLEEEGLNFNEIEKVS